MMKEREFRISDKKMVLLLRSVQLQGYLLGTLELGWGADNRV